MAELDRTVIKRTQETLGKFVKKPQLTDKLLSKPPFRFLHDVFNVIIKDTGCFKGLYSAEELVFENIKDRDDKMRFLQKMIDVIKLTTGKSVSVRTSKIVAGQEPEKTNELLQLMGEVIEKKLDWKSAIEQMKTGKAPDKDTSNAKQKTQEKQGERSKQSKLEKSNDVKDNKSKDIKARDTKSSSKTISPSTKPEKSVKKSTGASKEKTIRSTKDKQVLDSKDKPIKKSKQNTENPKPLKHRSGSKEKSPTTAKNEKSPSPVKNDTPKPVKEKEMRRKSSIEQNGVFEESLAATTEKLLTNAETKPDDSKTAQSVIQGQNTEIIDTVATTAPLTQTTEIESKQPSEAEAANEMELRKTSASRKGSSGKSRRSSASKAKREEAHAMQQSSNNNMDSLTTLKEVEAFVAHVPEGAKKTSPEHMQKQKRSPDHSIRQAAANVAAAAPAPAPNPAAAPTPTPTSTASPTMPVATASHDVKRESTFTRENSRDSNSTMGNRPRTSLRPPSARAASARPGAPRRRDRNVEIVLQPNDSVQLSGINVKLETFGDLDDDGENLVIIEDANASNMEAHNEVTPADVMDAESNLEQQGHLVQQILETQKDLMQQSGAGNNAGMGEKGNDSAHNLNGRQSSARQMNNLRDIIQNLTKSVNPFGKLMDFIPEDIDAMQLELTMWRDTYTQAANELKHEKSLTESAIEPMKNQLVQIDASIKEYVEMNEASRTKILQNTEKILKMLTEQ